MDRDKGLSRTTAITGALVVASLSGTLAVGLVARGAESAATTTTPTDDVPSSTDGPTGADTEGEAEPDGDSAEPPTLSPGDDGAGQATSGGS